MTRVRVVFGKPDSFLLLKLASSAAVASFRVAGTGFGVRKVCHRTASGHGELRRLTSPGPRSRMVRPAKAGFPGGGPWRVARPVSPYSQPAPDGGVCFTALFCHRLRAGSGRQLDGFRVHLHRIPPILSDFATSFGFNGEPGLPAEAWRDCGVIYQVAENSVADFIPFGFAAGGRHWLTTR